MLQISMTLLILIVGGLAEEKWVWSKNRQSHSIQDRQDRENRYENLRLDEEYDRQRIRDREPTTRRPDYSRPSSQQQNDDYGDYELDELRPLTKYGINRPGYQASQAPIPGNNLYPNPQNGILVGPGGPTGVIGRPQSQDLSRFPIPPENLKPNPASGILVGPGGPTGIIGRPPSYLPNSGVPGQFGPLGNGGHPGNIGPLGTAGPLGNGGSLGNGGPPGNIGPLGNVGPQLFPNSGGLPQTGASYPTNGPEGFYPGNHGGGHFPNGQGNFYPNANFYPVGQANHYPHGPAGVFPNNAPGNVYPGGQGNIYPGGQGNIYPGGIFPGGVGNLPSSGNGGFFPQGGNGPTQFPPQGLSPGRDERPGYGLYPAQYYPTNGITPYNGNGYASDFDGIDNRSDSKSKKDNLKLIREKDNIIKKSVNGKLSRTR